MKAENKTSTKVRIVEELKSILLTSLYFLCWFGSLMLIKVLLLSEYQIDVTSYAIVIIGALVVAKVVLVLEYVPLSFVRNKPAWIEVLSRSILYIAGVTLIMVLEKSFEARHEYGGVIGAFKNLSKHIDIYHLWLNVFCVFVALLFFNIWSVVKKHYGEGIFRKLMSVPVPENK